MGEYSLFIDIHEYRYKLKLFTDFYNYHRPHGGYGMMNMTDNAVQMGMFILSQEHHIHLRPKEWVSGE